MTIDASRYSPPRLPAVVSRQRLTARLQEVPDCRLALVTGQAAQGKTTLVADYLATREVPSAWLHLDSGDAESATFYHHLVRALSCALPGSDLDEYSEQTHISMGASEAIVRHEALLGSLWQRLPAETHLVLDSLEQLPAGKPVWSLLQRLVDLADDRGRLFLLSRQRPPLRMQQQAMRRTLLTLDNEELAFTPEEIVDYFQVVHGFTPGPECAASIRRATGGWAGGLVLISQTLGRQPRTLWDAFLLRQLPESQADGAWRYFAEEIFDALPREVKALLMRASLMEVIDPSILGELMAGQAVAPVLDDLVRRNLFIRIVYGRERQPLYRFNHLFRSFLKDRFLAACSPAEQRRIYEKLALLYRQRRQAEIALACYLAAGNHDAAAACTRKIGMDLVIRGRFAELAKAIAALPAEQTAADPWLFFLLTLTRRIRGGVRNIEDFTRVMTAFEKEVDTRGQLLALAYLIEAQVFAGHDPAGCRLSIERAETLLDTLSETPYYSYARALLWLQTGFACIAGGLDLSRGISACRNAYLLAHRIDSQRLMTNAGIVVVLGLALKGDFERADEALEKIAVHADTDAYTEYHALRGLVNAELALHRGDLASAERMLRPLAGEIETFGLLFLYPAYLDTLGCLQIYTRQFENARDTARHLLDVSSLSGNPCYEGMAHRLTALRLYFQGLYDAAAPVAGTALDLLPRDRRPTLHWMRARQLTGIVYLHLEQYVRAAEWLEEALQYFTETGNFLSLCETRLALGLLAHRQEDPAAAAVHLQAGFSLAAERQYDHFVILGPDDLERCCHLAGQYLERREPAWHRHLLRVRFPSPPPAIRSDTASTATEKPSQTGSGPVEREQPFLEIRTLGGFRVLRNGREAIGDRQWGGNRTKLLLKAILVHGLEEIPKEIIIEDLWPESRPGPAIQNFKVTLHRLRKCLEPDLQKHQRSAFVHLRRNRVSLDTGRCQVDVQVFLRCCKDIRRAAPAGETGTILELGKRVLALYRGDFLPEDPYASWMEMKRLALKDEYLAVLVVLADIYSDREKLEEAIECCQMAVAADGCLEKAGAKLMQLYLRTGRRSDAVKAYRQLKKNLEQELGVAPDPTITALYHRACQEL